MPHHMPHSMPRTQDVWWTFSISIGFFGKERFPSSNLLFLSLAFAVCGVKSLPCSDIYVQSSLIVTAGNTPIVLQSISPLGTETFELVLETICLAGKEQSCTTLDFFTRLSETKVAFWLCGDSTCLGYTLPFLLQAIPFALPGLTNVSGQLVSECGK